MPSLTKVYFEPEIVRILSGHPNIIGFKDSLADIIYLLERCPYLYGKATLSRFTYGCLKYLQSFGILGYVQKSKNGNDIAPLRINTSWAGASGRRKFHLVDWDQNGIPDLLIGGEDGFLYYKKNPRSVN